MFVIVPVIWDIPDGGTIFLYVHKSKLKNVKNLR